MAQNTPTQLPDRYGKKVNRRIDVIIGSTLAGLMVAGGIVFLATGGLPTEESSLEYRDIAHAIDDGDTRVSITFEVTAPAGNDLLCEVEALNKTYAVVGSRLIELPAIDQRTQTVTAEVRTHNRATTGTVKHCWVQPS